MSGEDDGMKEGAMKEGAKNDDGETNDGVKTDAAGGGRPAGEGVTRFPAAARAKACPICGKPVTLASRPFCSKRCADIDLGRWLGEAYRIPAAEAPDELDGDEGAPPDPQPRRR